MKSDPSPLGERHIYVYKCQRTGETEQGGTGWGVGTGITPADNQPLCTEKFTKIILQKFTK